MKKRFFSAFVFFILLFSLGTDVFAVQRGWWGKGYKTEKWVLSHSGSVLTYTISGAKNPDEYKAMMFKDGKYVEVEFGKSAKFDDWHYKNGDYVINFYKCKDSCMPHKYDNKTKIRSSDKKVASITLKAVAGQKTNIVFNAKNNSISVKSVVGGVVAKPKPVIDPFVEQKEMAKKNEGQQDPIFQAREKQYLFMQLSLNQKEVKIEDIDKYAKLGILPKFFSNNDK